MKKHVGRQLMDGALARSHHGPQSVRKSFVYISTGVYVLLLREQPLSQLKSTAASTVLQIDKLLFPCLICAPPSMGAQLVSCIS